MATHRIAVDGAQLHVEIDGDGPPLLLMNGAALNMRQWDGVIEQLAAQHLVVRHNVRGTGSSSPGPPSGYTFEQCAAGSPLQRLASRPDRGGRANPPEGADQ